MYLDGNPFERNLFSLILLVALIVAFTRGSRIVKVLKGNWPLLLFIGYCAVSLTWSDYPSVGFKRWTKLVGDLLMVLIVVTDVDPSGAFDRLMSRTAYVIVPVSILFIRYYPELGRGYDPWTGTAHWTGVTQNKNSLGMICMIVGLAELWRVIRELRKEKADRRKGVLLANGVIVVFVVYLLHMANSATSTTCFLLAGSLMVAMSFSSVARKPVMTHLLTAGMISLAACAAFFDFAGLVQDLGRKADLTGRTLVWSAALSQPVSRLLGAGYESFWLGDRLANVEKITGVFLNEAHNGYIEILVNLGWVGVTLLALLILTGYWRISRAILRNPMADYRGLAFFVAAVIYNYTEAAFKMTVPVWICFVWAIVSASPAAALAYSGVTSTELTSDVPGTQFRPGGLSARGLYPATDLKPAVSRGVRRPSPSSGNNDEPNRLQPGAKRGYVKS